MLSGSGQEILKQIGYWQFAGTILDYQGKRVAICEVDLLQRYVILQVCRTNDKEKLEQFKLTFDQAARLHVYEEIRYS